MHRPVFPSLHVFSIASLLALTACGDGGGDRISDAAGGDDAEASDATLHDASTPDSGPSDTRPHDTVDDASGVTDGTEPGGGDLLTYCAWYKTCGGTFYDTAEDCAAASIEYWGECRRPWLDAFGACMLAVSCEDWGDPDLFDPADTPCAEAYRDIEEAPCP